MIWTRYIAQPALISAACKDTICKALEQVEQNGPAGGHFQEDLWQHPDGGGGITRVLLDGSVFEKAGVNFSQVRGTLPAQLAEATPGKGANFSATGISLVLHPRNPNVPTVHANFRHICKGDAPEQTSWFGGGSDLTPFYLRREDVIHFHCTWKQACERHAVADYARFKNSCDEYFYLPHRGEARGVGGSSSITSMTGWTRFLLLCATLVTIFSRLIVRYSSGEGMIPLPKNSANGNSCAAGATSNLIYYTIAAPRSA